MKNVLTEALHCYILFLEKRRFHSSAEFDDKTVRECDEKIKLAQTLLRVLTSMSESKEQIVVWKIRPFHLSGEEFITHNSVEALEAIANIAIFCQVRREIMSREDYLKHPVTDASNKFFGRWN